MKILIVHNHYQQPGGEDAVVADEYALLKHFQEDVYLHERSNNEFQAWSTRHQLKHFLHLDYSNASYRSFSKVLDEIKPEVVHFHNTFYMLTPAVYQACLDHRMPVVQSLHNFRLMCSNALFFRNNQVCEDCVSLSLWEGIRHRCYRNSFLLTAFVAKMLHRTRCKRIWQQQIHRYITATEFTRQKYIQFGIPAEKIAVKPHFVFHDPGVDLEDSRGDFVLYAGRLSAEKGINVAIEAWEEMKSIPLKIIGDGPLSHSLRNHVQARDLPNIEFLGYVSPEEFARQMRQARCLIVPSLCYENFPRIVVEAFSYGVPIIASRLGSLMELIEEGKTGWLFNAGDSNDLARKVEHVFRDRQQDRQINLNCRRVYEEKYTPAQNYQRLMSIYSSVIGF